MNATLPMSDSKPAARDHDPYLKKFERFEKETEAPAWLLPLRKSGLARFSEIGFPTLQHEDYRFTNIAPIAKLPFKPATESDANGVPAEALAKFTFAGQRGARLVFVNGRFAPALSLIGWLPAGMCGASLAAALKMDRATVQEIL